MSVDIQLIRAALLSSSAFQKQAYGEDGRFGVGNANWMVDPRSSRMVLYPTRGDKQRPGDAKERPSAGGAGMDATLRSLIPGFGTSFGLGAAGGLGGRLLLRQMANKRLQQAMDRGISLDKAPRAAISSALGDAGRGAYGSYATAAKPSSGPVIAPGASTLGKVKARSGRRILTNRLWDRGGLKGMRGAFRGASPYLLAGGATALLSHLLRKKKQQAAPKADPSDSTFV